MTPTEAVVEHRRPVGLTEQLQLLTHAGEKSMSLWLSTEESIAVAAEVALG